jgi:hypothetical protein
VWPASSAEAHEWQRASSGTYVAFAVSNALVGFTQSDPNRIVGLASLQVPTRMLARHRVLRPVLSHREATLSGLPRFRVVGSAMLPNCSWIISTAASLRCQCGSFRLPTPEYSVQRIPIAASHAGQGTDNSCFRVSAIVFISQDY